MKNEAIGHMDGTMQGNNTQHVTTAYNKYDTIVTRQIQQHATYNMSYTIQYVTQYNMHFTSTCIARGDMSACSM